MQFLTSFLPRCICTVNGSSSLPLLHDTSLLHTRCALSVLTEGMAMLQAVYKSVEAKAEAIS